MNGKVPMTPAGFAKLKEQLKKLMNEERPRIMRDIEEARAHGDLSENAEYHAAKERQGFIEKRIAELNSKIARAEVIDPTRISTGKISFGSVVTLINVATEKEVTYQIVGEDEAEINDGKISVFSPMARAMIGREIGEEIEVRAPSGIIGYEVLDIRCPKSPSDK
ncbi:MAG: transcription elongation factor GreA [Nitrospirae bacterium CG_4_9_14_3_um_filter_53_35]|nr:MAG: transcription elongation factor GreA [Nitrospirae bacterium CG2_30_53_67]PIS35936.1 MAG: transcription elongation factor GreA [Nitrospirae bacterium CG08_land_8_20_14_0_20_52_24]PIV84606.1 MAG: transcription elongation factor GreA [Nitrospirae bacterium CG17_big_fil_post_rev_8_21_14_2_50_50_9]PIW85095.1 MAG: transcription elongation factor GreA [Nitrospirae bacterium CG_4_8_14_3_um_filter_50_41]PIX84568.1 MAG: transcription elongation factor GreA [Nitrospirae bacterium CG_4_10_14_3_um_f